MNENEAREAVAAMSAKGATPNQAAFAEWLLDASGYAAGSAAERAAFLAASAIALRAYHLWQAAKPTSSRYKAATAKAAPAVDAGPDAAATGAASGKGQPAKKATATAPRPRKAAGAATAAATATAAEPVVKPKPRARKASTKNATAA